MAEERSLALRPESADDFTQRLANYGRLAKGVVEARLAPRGMDAPGVVVAMQLGFELGLSPMQAVQSINVINGKATLSGEAAVAVIRQSGYCERWDMGMKGEGDAMLGYAITKRHDDSAEYERTFTVADARLAGLWNKTGPWKQYPSRMLMWRAVGFLARDVYPDAMRGARITEEAADIPSETHGELRDVTPKPANPELAATVLESIGVSGPPEDPPVPEPSPPITGGDADVQGPEVDPNTGERVPSTEELDHQFVDDELQAAFDLGTKK